MSDPPQRSHAHAHLPNPEPMSSMTLLGPKPACSCSAFNTSSVPERVMLPYTPSRPSPPPTRFCSSDDGRVGRGCSSREDANADKACSDEAAGPNGAWAVGHARQHPINAISSLGQLGICSGSSRREECTCASAMLLCHVP
eukprot:365930-Chlamydomonas_euryale.AAC.24